MRLFLKFKKTVVKQFQQLLVLLFMLMFYFVTIYRNVKVPPTTLCMYSGVFIRGSRFKKKKKTNPCKKSLKPDFFLQLNFCLQIC